MSTKKDYSKKILKILSKKPAVPLKELADCFNENNYKSDVSSKKVQYAINRSIKNLEEGGLIEQIYSGQKEYARITKDGKKKAYSIDLDSPNSIVNLSWDGYWRIIILDIPEERKSERESLRYLLKKAGFVCVKNSMWVSMMPYEHLFSNIKTDLGLNTEIMIMLTDKIDRATENYLLKIFGFKQ